MATSTSLDSSKLLSNSQNSISFNSILDGPESEERWQIQITKILDQEDKATSGVWIFSVPKALSVFKPEAYIPQLMGLGPYHHFCAKLYEMERYKIAAARRFTDKHFQNLKFPQLVGTLNEFESGIRAHYHRYLDIDGNTLSWIMAIDGFFLLEFLDTFVNVQKKGKKTAQLVDSSGRKLAHDEVLSDIMMLENQIPIFLLRKIVSNPCSSADIDDNWLADMLRGFCKAVSPLPLQNLYLSPSEVLKHAHLLDLLYHLIVPETEESHQHENYGQSKAPAPVPAPAPEETTNSSKTLQTFSTLGKFLSNMNIGLVRKVTRPIKAILGVSLVVIKGLPDIVSKKKENNNPENEGSSDEETRIPMIEEIMIPSVSDLRDVGVKFCASTGFNINFDKKKKLLSLPVLKLNVNSEVIIRNLVAYEASVFPEFLVFTRYTELLTGIIDTAEDAKFLKKNKIIENGLKNYDEVAQIFNGMSKSIQLSKLVHIDVIIKHVNEYYYGTRKVRAYECMKKYVYGSWRILTLFAAILLMLLMGMQSFCTVYSCPRILNNMEN